ncbi:hypothetical protein Y023_5586 [Burkholderia pseudomallei A79D]|nr:hypothetical protein Y023_5586 [Burkholderia pseudomallei A79D]KGX95706.1 hypothetical protein X997_5371 [Burkholderia pseudomallei A79C]
MFSQKLISEPGLTQNWRESEQFVQTHRQRRSVKQIKICFWQYGKVRRTKRLAMCSTPNGTSADLKPH